VRGLVEPTGNRWLPPTRGCGFGEQEKGGLADIFRVVPVPEHVLRCRKDEATVTVNQGSERALVLPGREAVEEFPIGDIGGDVLCRQAIHRPLVNVTDWCRHSLGPVPGGWPRLSVTQ